MTKHKILFADQKPAIPESLVTLPKTLPPEEEEGVGGPFPSSGPSGQGSAFCVFKEQFQHRRAAGGR